jgi:CheY-like chemotaxis protein
VPQRVLVIDDEKHVRDMLAHILPTFGLEVTTCENATEALLQPTLRDFHCIITDHDMPGMNGINLTKRLRERLPFTVIIGMSGTDKSLDFHLAGANEFLQKPFVPDHLALLISETGSSDPNV